MEGAMEQTQREATRRADRFLAPLRRWVMRAIPRAFAEIATAVYGVAGDWRGWRPVLARTSAHLAVVVVAVAAIGLSSIKWPAQTASMSALSALPVAARGESEATTDVLLAEFDVEADRCERELLTLLGGMVAHGLIEVLEDRGS